MAAPKVKDTAVSLRLHRHEIRVTSLTLVERHHGTPHSGRGDLRNVGRTSGHAEALTNTHEQPSSDEGFHVRREDLNERRDDDDEQAQDDTESTAESLRSGRREEEAGYDSSAIVG